MEVPQCVTRVLADLTPHIRETLSRSRPSPTLDEAIVRMQLCGNRYTRVEHVQEGTKKVYQLMKRLAGVVKTAAPSSTAYGMVRAASVASGESCVRAGCLNPHRNGLLNVQGSAVSWSRLKNERVGLLRAMSDFDFSFIGFMFFLFSFVLGVCCGVPWVTTLPCSTAGDGAAQ